MHEWPVTISLPTGLTIGGVTSWAVQLTRNLALRGRRVRLVVHDPYERQDEVVDCRPSADGAFEVIRAPSLKRPESWPESLRLYRDLLPTILLPNTLAESYAIAASLSSVHSDRVRNLAWCHSDNAYDYAYLAYYEPIIAAYLAVSRQCQDELRRRLPARAADVAWLPYGVFVPPAISRPRLEGRPIRLAYVGRMEQTNKRIFDLVEMAERLDRRGIRFELRMVGDGPQTQELQQRVTASVARFRNPSNEIRCEPPVSWEAAQAIWRWADVSLLASQYEGFNIATLEAMANGCVPVVSRVRSGVGDLIRDGDNGLTFPVGEIDSMTACVERLMRNADSVSAMSGRACRDAAEMCGYERYLDRVTAAMDAVIDSDPPRWSPSRPVLMGGAPESHGPCRQESNSVPADAADRLRRALSGVASMGGPIALYGAGNHTRALAHVLADTPVEIVAILDDDYSLRGRQLWGWPILPPDAVLETSARAVIISSFLHEEEICERQRARLEMAGLRVVRLYKQLRSPDRLPAGSLAS